MPLDELEPDEVVALRYEDETSGPDLAAWCGGQVGVDLDPADGREIPIVRVPTPTGVQRALIGDWIVRGSDGEFSALSNAEFAARHRPA